MYTGRKLLSPGQGPPTQWHRNGLTNLLRTPVIGTTTIKFIWVIKCSGNCHEKRLVCI